MKIKDIGGEFALIQRLADRVPGRSSTLVTGIGDDAAVIETAPPPAPLLLVTTDMLVENCHFKAQWATPRQIGIKAAECNASDIAAMGGRPSWMFVSLCLRSDCDVEWPEALYDGIAASCRSHGIVMAGGDTTRGSSNMVSITLLGQVERGHLTLRSGAQHGDILMVSGKLGASAAALGLLAQGKQPDPDLLAKHLTPTCRLDISAAIAPLANAMIDVSDGVGSDLRHICNQSGVSAEIDAQRLPIHPAVFPAAEDLGVRPLDLALTGGEDYELLFSVSPEVLPRLTSLKLDCHAIGRILPGEDPPVLIGEDGKKRPLVKGFDHFSRL